MSDIAIPSADRVQLTEAALHDAYTAVIRAQAQGAARALAYAETLLGVCQQQRVIIENLKAQLAAYEDEERDSRVRSMKASG